MAAIFDFECLAHGYFEGTIGKCPHGCGGGMVKKVFLKAPGAMSDKTKTTDRLRTTMMDRYGLTDIQTKAGRPAVPDNYRWNQPNVENRTKPYSVPIDAQMDGFGNIVGDDTAINTATSLGAVPEEQSTLLAMKQTGKLNMKVNVIADDRKIVTAEAIQSADPK